MSNELDPNAPIWGVREIAAVINRTERATKHLIATGNLPVGKVSRRIYSTERRLRDWLDSRIADPE